MQTFISDIIPQIQRFSKKLDDLTLLTNQHWVVLDELQTRKMVYIFRKGNELLISVNGKVEKGKWEHLGNNSILIDKGNDSYLFKHGLFDENVLALKIDGKNEYAFLINETKFMGELDSFGKVNSFLREQYLQLILTPPSLQKDAETVLYPKSDFDITDKQSNNLIKGILLLISLTVVFYYIIKFFIEPIID